MKIEEFDEMLRETARDSYHPPPPVPREEIWARLEAARAAGRGSAGGDTPSSRSEAPRTRSPLARLSQWGMGIAAVLALGIGIGRLAERRQAEVATTSPASYLEAEPGGTRAVTFRLAALEHLGRSEVLLTSFRADAQAGRVDTELQRWTHELLTETRLLLDSPAAMEPRLEALLQDLELVLVQIAQYPANHTQSEFDLIDQALEENDIVTRLRLSVPSGPILARS
jgi:hypothetical protein